MEEKIKYELEKIRQLTLIGVKNYLTIDDVVEYTGISKNVIYRYMRAKLVPFSKPSGKRAFFKKTDVDAWLGSNRVASSSEIEEQAARYCVTHK